MSDSKAISPKPGGKGRGGFPYDEDETRTIVREMLAEDSGAGKASLAKYYNTSVATLNKKAVELGLKEPPQARAGGRRRAPSESGRKTPSVFEQLEALSENVGTAMEELEREESELRERLEEIQDKKALLQRIAALSE